MPRKAWKNRGAMAERPDLLLITPVVPDPRGAGLGLRAWAWLNVLGRDHAVHVLLASEREVGSPPVVPGAASVHVLAVGRPAPRQRRSSLAFPILALRSGFHAEFLQVTDRRRGALDWLAAIRPVRIVVFRLYLHEVASVVRAELPAARAEVDLDDLESRSRLSIARCSFRLGNVRAGLHELNLAVQYWLAERVLLARYDAIHLAAREDLDGIGRRHRPRVAEFRNRLAPQPLLKGAKPFRVLFIGSLGYPPNVEAATLLANAVAPLLAHLPHLRVTVAGREPSNELRRRLAGDPRIDLIADPSDLAPLYAEALAVVVPLRAGGGTKFKTIEAFAYGRPVISTAEGVRGLGAEAGRHYLPAETASEFAAAVSRLAHDSALAGDIGAAGNRLWREELSL